MSAGTRTDMRGHVEDVAHKAVEGVGANVGGETATLTSVRVLGEGALVAAEHVVGYVVEHLRPRVDNARRIAWYVASRPR